MLFRSEIPLVFFVQGIKHIDQFARRCGIKHRLAGTWVCIGSEDHSRIAAEHADQILKRGHALWRFDRPGGRSFCLCRAPWRRVQGCLALFFLNYFRTDYSLRSKWSTVDDAEAIVLLVIGQRRTLKIVNIYNIYVSLSRVARLIRRQIGDSAGHRLVKALDAP